MSFMAKKRWLYLTLSLLMSLLSFSAFAQRSDGNIGGDAAPGDQICVVNTGTSLKRESVADASGKFRIRNLPVGEYRVTVTRNGETAGNFVVTVRPGATARVPSVAADNQAAAEPTGETAVPTN